MILIEENNEAKLKILTKGENHHSDDDNLNIQSMKTRLPLLNNIR